MLHNKPPTVSDIFVEQKQQSCVCNKYRVGGTGRAGGSIKAHYVTIINWTTYLMMDRRHFGSSLCDVPSYTSLLILRPPHPS